MLMKRQNLSTNVFASIIIINYTFIKIMCIIISYFGLNMNHVCTIGCHVLLKILQTFLSKKYAIPIYEMFGFLSFQSFPASSRVSPVTAKNTKDFQNLQGKNVPYALFSYFILKQFLRPNWDHSFTTCGFDLT